MEWAELTRITTDRPGMWVGRPYIDGLTALWLGFSLGASDGIFDHFCSWVRCDRFPAEGGARNPLALNALIRAEVGGGVGPLSEQQDDRGVAILRDLIEEFDALQMR